MLSVNTEFTPLMSLIGGALIGISTIWFLLSTGRIAGISGVVSGLFGPISKPKLVGLAFVSGLVLAPIVYKSFVGTLPEHTVSSNYIMLAIAGLLVGFGTVVGNGCTSGHGVCGISRLSWRSVIATCVFMMAAFGTVFLLRHVLGV